MKPTVLLLMYEDRERDKDSTDVLAAAMSLDGLRTFLAKEWGKDDDDEYRITDEGHVETRELWADGWGDWMPFGEPSGWQFNMWIKSMEVDD